MTREEIIALAFEAGLADARDTAESLPVDYVEALQSFATLVAEREREYADFTIAELVRLHESMETTAVDAAYQRGVRDEREECAKIAERETGVYAGKHAAAAIRKRTKC